MADVITSIKCDLEHDKIMIDQIKEKIKELEIELRYYQGKHDGRNEAYKTITDVMPK